MPRNIGLYQNVCDFDEAAQITGYAPDTLRAYHGTTLNIPSIRIAGRVMFLQGELEQWMSKRAMAHRQPEVSTAGAVRAAEEWTRAQQDMSKRPSAWGTDQRANQIHGKQFDLAVEVLGPEKD
jgi:hypothetical protein